MNFYILDKSYADETMGTTILTFRCMLPSHKHERMKSISVCISISTVSLSYDFCVNAVFRTPVEVHTESQNVVQIHKESQNVM